VLRQGQTVTLAEDTVLITKDGGQVSIADSGAPIRDSRSEIVGVVIVFRDVTREKEREEELIKIKKLESLGVLAGGIAHDFNNLLSAILGNIELASSSVKDDDNAASLLLEAQKATRRAAKLTQQLLTFSRGGDPVKEETSLINLVQESADFVLHGSRIACEYIFADELWMVEADSGQVGQVIQNIVINAKHAMPDGGKILISCYNVEDKGEECPMVGSDARFVCIKIEDSGIGIPAEIVDKVFDPYFTTKQEGSGLGLAVCHSIISKHGGYLTVKSQPGSGTTFFVCLPSGVSVDKTVVVPQLEESVVRAKLIMVMDDEEMIRDVSEAQLSRLGHEVVLVKDGKQAVARYQELQALGTPVDLVITDLTIPGGMGGQEAAREILAGDPAAKLIVASGYSNDPVMASYREYGFCAAITKPFNMRELREAIVAALQ
jgi:signal transduction histidine kinase/ActR/RegA family two-component response regulator